MWSETKLNATEGKKETKDLTEGKLTNGKHEKSQQKLEWLTNRSVLLLICCHKIRFSKLNLHKYTYNLITKNNIFSRKHHPVVTFYPSTLFTSCATVLFNRLVMVYVHKKKFLKHTPKSHGEFSLFPTDKKTWVFFKIPTVWKTQNTW